MVRNPDHVLPTMDEPRAVPLYAKRQGSARADARRPGARRSGNSTRTRVHDGRALARADARRRGTVLVLVMTILGILFVTGVAFLATMSFEAEMVMVARQRDEMRPGVDNVIDPNELMLGDAVPAPEVLEKQKTPYSGDVPPIGEDRLGGALPELAPISFADTPGIYNYVAPIEPYIRSSDGHLVFPWFTDVEALHGVYYRNTNPTVEDYRAVEVDTSWISGVVPNEYQPEYDAYFPEVYPRLTPADADGDGIVDSMQVDLALLGVDPSRRKAIAKVVNPASNPDGNVYLALRVVSHGAMVNLTYGHPELIRNLFLLNDYNYELPQEKERYQPYTPAAEEPSLRRRAGLPAEELPPTQVQGNPLSTNTDTWEGDFAEALFPPGEDLLHHRYWPYRRTDEIDGFPIYQMRMTPDGATTLSDDHYDRRHLVTTISHDDLLRRATPVIKTMHVGNVIEFVQEKDDLLDLMREANRRDFKVDNQYFCENSVSFEYADYPHTLVNTHNVRVDPDGVPPNVDYLRNSCYCEGANADAGKDVCQINPLKGRLRLSLPWLDSWLNIDNADPDRKKRAVRLVQDVFTLLLLNARGEEWRSGDLTSLEDPDTDGYAYLDKNKDAYSDTPYDVDGNGTIEPDEWVQQVWQHDFAEIERVAASLTANLFDFADSDDIPTRVEVRNANFNDAANFGKGTGEFVYGLERQPFITEVTALNIDLDHDEVTDTPSASFFGVEIFNPYPEIKAPNGQLLRDGGIELFNLDLSTPLEDQFKYGIRTSTGTYWLSDAVPMPTRYLTPRTFLGYWDFTQPSGAGNLIELPLLHFEGGKIELVRELNYDSGPVVVVVDEMDIDSEGIGEPSDSSITLTKERLINTLNTDAWYAPLPEFYAGVESLGLASTAVAPVKPPVVVEIPNSGTLTDAFPTTGSLLLLMRHANSTNHAFTWYLDTNPFPIDNGRMPIFDLKDPIAPNDPYRHHVDPRNDPSVAVDALNRVHNTVGRAGNVTHLPWGQLVFDYFTALPLSNGGPFATADEFPNNDPQLPRIDRDGARVHGRINLNAAPWSIMSGLPFVPMERIPVPFRATFRSTLTSDQALNARPDEKPLRLGVSLAKAIVAYRDQRSWQDGVPTGSYGEYQDPATLMLAPDPNGRAWDLASPTIRRGRGFLTVGELANVRHPGLSTLGQGKFDSGEATATGEDYYKAIAVLASLSDWATVRSHVFTIYGTLRGEMDDSLPASTTDVERAADVDSRALRFQETVDRWPTLFSKKPESIGDPVLRKYNDVHSD